MDVSEIFALILCGILTCAFLYRWYRYTYAGWPSARNQRAKNVFAVLPLFSLAIILFTLEGLASFDVIGNAFWTFFYIIMGYAWIYAGLTAISMFFDISWIDDVLNLNNNAALIALTGGFLGLTMIYSGANIGSGPGWWCVIFAGGLGLTAWIILGLIITAVTRVFYRITVERDICCGIRTGSYFLASGLILGRASAGDWTSFEMTLIEFLDGWPVLILALAVILIELGFKGESKAKGFSKKSKKSDNNLYASIIIGFIYIKLAITCIILSPSLPVNPEWGIML